ncbi:MAG: hypothetical protein ACK5NA_10320 [Enterococcus sp.]
MRKRREKRRGRKHLTDSELVKLGNIRFAVAASILSMIIIGSCLFFVFKFHQFREISTQVAADKAVTKTSDTATTSDSFSFAGTVKDETTDTSTSKDADEDKDTDTSDVDETALTDTQLEKWVRAVVDKRSSELTDTVDYRVEVIDEAGKSYAKIILPTGNTTETDLFKVNENGELAVAKYDEATGKKTTDWTVLSKKYLDTSSVDALDLSDVTGSSTTSEE